jgi:hypothetical protein
MAAEGMEAHGWAARDASGLRPRLPFQFLMEVHIFISPSNLLALRRLLNIALTHAWEACHFRTMN